MPYDKEKADRAVNFIKLLKHTKGRWAGAPFNLQPWQEEEIIRPLFGTVTPEGYRQYRTAFIEVPRKNGKSELAAAIALYMLFADNEYGAEIYSAAADRDQASIVFNIAAQMVRQSPSLSKRCKIIDSQKRIVYYKTNSFYRAISADAYSKHGYNAHCVIYDELHAAPNRELWDVLATSMGARAQPLMLAITTAGYDQNSICYEQYEYAKKVLDGTIEDPSFFAYIREADPEDDWKDPKTWEKANPNLGITVSKEFLEQECRKAQEIPAYQNTFKRLYLNVWTQQANRWIDLDLWDSNFKYEIAEEELAGRTCYGGLDLSSVSDITAWVLVFPKEDDPEEVEVLCRFWCPTARLHDSRNKYRDQYVKWAQEGWLTATPGEAVDYSFVKKQILEDAERFALVDFNVDRLFQGHQLSNELMEEGLTVVGMGQGFMSMSTPTKELERRLIARKINHGNNPVLRWMADNVAVKQDAAGNLKPDKASSQGKIDGIVALIMALDRCMRHEKPERSVYEDRGILVL